MDVAKLKVDRTYASAVYREIITAGLVGTTISVEYAPGIWDGLTKTVVFRGSVSKDVITNDTTIEIPPEVLTEPNKRLSVGFCGMDHVNRLVIPTIWADLGLIHPGADPSGDTSTDPSLPVWGQIASRVEEIAEDVEQLKQTGGGGSGGNVDFVVQDTEPEDTSVLWIDPDDNSDDGFQEAVNTALAQAKASGEFNGKDYVLTPDDKTEIAEMAAELVEVPEGSGGGIAVTGATVGQTVKIAEVDENGVPTAWESVDFPSDEHINGLINTALGVIENGTY